MDDTKAQEAPDEQIPAPETPEDIAILYSWANIPGAKYRDFSASRRQYRAQQRARVAEQQRQAELQAASDLEDAAQREFEEAQRIREESRQSDLARPGGWDEQSRSRELVRRAEEHALLERQEAQRRQRSAETLRMQAQRARSEMLEARKRAEEQATRYAEAAAQYHEEVRAEAQRAVPGETSDPYYYTGQVDPAYFASTPGVRTAQAARISSERRTYSYPVHPGSEEQEAGSLQAYRSSTTFAPSPSQTFRPVGSTKKFDPRGTPVERKPSHNLPETESREDSTYPADNGYYDGKPPVPSAARSGVESAALPKSDVLIRPVSRNPEPFVPELPEFPVEAVQEERAFTTEQLTASLPRLPSAAVVQPELARVAQASHPKKIAAHEAFAMESQMFFHADRPEQNLISEAEPEPVHAGEDIPERAETMKANRDTVPAFLLMERETELESRQREFPHDSHVRLSRHAGPLVANPIRQERRGSSQLSPSWLEAPGKQVQRFLPSRPRSGTSQRASASSAQLPPSSGTMEPESRRAPRYSRNLDRGKSYSAITEALGRRRASLNRNDAFQQAGEQFTPDAKAQIHKAPDTLQQSRERVASRWFALKDVLEHGHEATAPMQSVELRVPSLCVMSLNGGVGKTSIAATLGRALSSQGEKVLLADTNSYGLLPYYYGARELRHGSVRTYTPPSGNMGAPVLLVNYELEGSNENEAKQKRVIEEIGKRAKGNQRVVIDMSLSGAWLARRLASLHPWVLVPVAPDTNSVVTAQAVEQLFEGVVDASGHPVLPYYVLNQYDPSMPLHLDVREVLRRSLGERLLHVTLHRSPAVAEALAEGMTVIDYAPFSQIAKDYMDLAIWLRSLSAPAPGEARGARWSEG